MATLEAPEAGGFQISIGTLALRSTLSATLPSTARWNPPKPRVAIAITSGRHASAASPMHRATWAPRQL